MTTAKKLRASVFQPVYERITNEQGRAEFRLATVVRCSECHGLTEAPSGVPPANCEHCGKSEVLFD